MKTNLSIIIGLLFLFTFTGCEKDVENIPEIKPGPGLPGETPSDLPDGYFEVTFSPSYGDYTRAAVAGTDGRVRHLRYVIYKSSGEFVKEKVVLTSTDVTPSWPLAAVKDTLPRGEYVAVFLANVEKTLFPIPGAGGTTTYQDVLQNYQTLFADARIVLPNAEFADNSEYYWARMPFSNQNAQPYILLQRIITMLNVHRNFVDAQTALNKLVNNIVTQVGYKNYIQNTVTGLLSDSLRKVLDRGPVFNLVYNVVGGLDNAINAFATPLIVPVTNALYDILLQQLVNQVGLALTGNADQNGALAGIGALLNPWQPIEAHAAAVTIRNFPKTMDFNLNVKDYYTGDHQFIYKFTGGTIYDEKDILIKGFHGKFDVRKIMAIKDGLIAGLVFDQIIDGPYLLNGVFVNITDSLEANVATNFRYEANYSFLDLGLKSYTQQTDGPHTLSLSVKLGNIANIDGILTGIPLLGPLLATTLNVVLTPIKNITIILPVNIPLLGVDNLTLSGSWSTVTPY